MRSSSADPHLWAVVLAGGIGSRFWPVSTPSRPKQVLPLAGDRPLIAETLDRIAPLIPGERLRLLAGRELAAPLREAVPELGDAQQWVEPLARGTAPVLVWAAWRIHREDPDAVMVSLHSDHVIDPPEAFRELLADVAALTGEHRRLFTIGVEPDRPETGYGYIRVGDRLRPTLDVYEVEEFVEKPDHATASEYLLRGGYLWNSGLFLWRVDTFLDEVEEHAPEIASLLPLLEKGDERAFFERAPSISVDEAILERSRRVAVARATFRWDDVGAWNAVARTRAADPAGNVAVGAAHLVDCENCIGWADDGHVVVFGARDLVVVRAGEVTLVVPAAQAPRLKDLIRQLPSELRPEAGA